MQGTPDFRRERNAPYHFHSLEYRYGDGCKLRRNGRPVFYIQNVGEVKVKYHRPIPDDAKMKHVVIKKALGRWYVCLQCEIPKQETILNLGPPVGIDMGLKSLIALSDGTTIDNPR